MYQINLNDASCSDKYNDEISRFVSTNTSEMLEYHMEIIEDSDFNLKFLFPEAYVDSHSRSECLKVLKTLRDRMQSFVFYDSLTPLQNMCCIAQSKDGLIWKEVWTRIYIERLPII